MHARLSYALLIEVDWDCYVKAAVSDGPENLGCVYLFYPLSWLSKAICSDGREEDRWQLRIVTRAFMVLLTTKVLTGYTVMIHCSIAYLHSA